MICGENWVWNWLFVFLFFYGFVCGKIVPQRFAKKQSDAKTFLCIVWLETCGKSKIYLCESVVKLRGTSCGGEWVTWRGGETWNIIKSAKISEICGKYSVICGENWVWNWLFVFLCFCLFVCVKIVPQRFAK